MPATASQSNANQMPADKTATKKTVVKKETAAPAAAVAAPAPAAEEKKTVRARKPAAAKAEVTVPVVQATPAAAPEAAAAAPAGEPSLLAVVERLREVQTRLTGELKELAREALAAHKAATRAVKDARKKRRTQKDVSEMTPEEKAAWEARRANNAFLKPRPLSADLCSFMGVAAGSQRSQTEVTKFISQYVKSHSCFDPANKRRIIPDGALAKLLKVTDKDTVTYLNLQSYLKAHFLKA